MNCFGCGSPDHMIKDCPERSTQITNFGMGSGKGMDFSQVNINEGNHQAQLNLLSMIPTSEPSGSVEGDRSGLPSRFINYLSQQSADTYPNGIEEEMRIMHQHLRDSLENEHDDSHHHHAEVHQQADAEDAIRHSTVPA